MKRKIIMLIILIVLVTSSLVFADNPKDSNPYYVVLESGVILTCPYPIEYVYYSDTAWKSTYYQQTGISGSHLTTYRLDGTKSVSDAYPSWTYNEPVLTSHNIFYKGTTDLFFKPLTFWSVGMEGAQQILLNPFLANLPIILGMLVLLIGFHKAYRMLSTSLKGA